MAMTESMDVTTACWGAFLRGSLVKEPQCEYISRPTFRASFEKAQIRFPGDQDQSGWGVGGYSFWEMPWSGLETGGD